jgi:hypothetical protein
MESVSVDSCEADGKVILLFYFPVWNLTSSSTKSKQTVESVSNMYFYEKFSVFNNNCPSETVKFLLHLAK